MRPHKAAMIMTAEDVSQIQNKNLSTCFVDAIKELEEIAKSYKERALMTQDNRYQK